MKQSFWRNRKGESIFACLSVIYPDRQTSIRFVAASLFVGSGRSRSVFGVIESAEVIRAILPAVRSIGFRFLVRAALDRAVRKLMPAGAAYGSMLQERVAEL
jgi:hypothetical protein